MCVLYASADGKQREGIKIYQTIESIAHNYNDKHALIMLDILVSNNNTKDAQLYVLHRGRVYADNPVTNLLDYATRRNSENKIDDSTIDELLYKIYTDRISIDKDRKVSFVTRKDAFTLGEKQDIDYMKQEKIFCEYAKYTDEDLFPPFTALLINPIPPGKSWQRVQFWLKGVSYSNLVANNLHFEVDGPSHVLHQIETVDLVNRWFRLPGAEDFFNQNIKNNLLKSDSYEVVIFQPGTNGVDEKINCQPLHGTIETTISDIKTRAMANLFVSQSDLFWIDLSFQNNPHLREPNQIESDSQIVEVLKGNGILL